MDDKQLLDHNFETIAWGMLFILWGITLLLDFLPAGLALVGTGVVLLGLNAARRRNGVPSKSGTTVLAILALVAGGLNLASALLPLPFELSFLTVCAIMLIVLGIIVLVRALFRVRKLGFGGLQ